MKTLFLLPILLMGCASISPNTKIVISPPSVDQERTIKIEQSRLGKTSIEIDGDKISVSYDSKGKSLLVGATETIQEIGKVVIMERLLD